MLFELKLAEPKELFDVLETGEAPNIEGLLNTDVCPKRELAVVVVGLLKAFGEPKAFPPNGAVVFGASPKTVGAVVSKTDGVGVNTEVVVTFTVLGAEAIAAPNIDKGAVVVVAFSVGNCCTAALKTEAATLGSLLSKNVDSCVVVGGELLEVVMTGAPNNVLETGEASVNKDVEEVVATTTGVVGRLEVVAEGAD